ncbi:MAG: Crp/Fnr family transcriptional regulator [Leptolyngbyaceae cyanobacterium]
MYDSTLSLPPLNYASIQAFRRREYMPLREGVLWQIRVGIVRLLTIGEEGSLITLGFWGAGDLVGHPLARIQPCQIECLTNVEAMRLEIGQCGNLQQVMLTHIAQMQELIRIRHGQIAKRLQLLLTWLATKFGSPTEQGHLINLRLTHQQIAEAIGTSRVTVTRLLLELERNNCIGYSGQQCIILHDHGWEIPISGY